MGPMEGGGAGHRVLVFAQLKAFLQLVEEDVLMPGGVSFLRLDGRHVPCYKISAVQRLSRSVPCVAAQGHALQKPQLHVCILDSAVLHSFNSAGLYACRDLKALLPTNYQFVVSSVSACGQEWPAFLLISKPSSLCKPLTCCRGAPAPQCPHYSSSVSMCVTPSTDQGCAVLPTTLAAAAVKLYRQACHVLQCGGQEALQHSAAVQQ